MSSTYQKLILLVKKIRLKIIFSTLIEQLILFTGISIFIFFFYVLLDYFLNFLQSFRSLFLPFLISFFFASLLILTFLKIRAYWGKEKIALLVAENYPNLKDDFLNALQLGESRKLHFSEELINALIDEVSEKIKIVKSAKVFPPLRLREYIFLTLFSFLIFMFTYFLFPRIFNYSLARLFLIEYVGKINVLPGNLSLPRGSNLEIVAEIFPSLEEMVTYRSKPLIFYRYEEVITSRGFVLRVSAPKGNHLKGKWKKNLMTFEKSKSSGIRIYRFLFPSVLENLEYRVALGKLSSPLYQVKVISPPEIGDLSFEYHYPSYTQLLTEKIEKTNGDVKTLLGTKVVLEAKVNKPLKKANLVFADGEIKELKYEKNKVRGEILVNKKNTYWFELLDEEGYTNPEPSKYKIEIKNDEFPKIEFLSPNEDLVVSEKSKLKLTYQAIDDFGLKQVDLFYCQEKKKDWYSLTITYFSPGKKEELTDWEWDLSKFSFSPGEIVEYYLQVTDNDTISGPKKSSTKILKIEIFSYEREHQEIENALYSFRENLLDLLAEQIEAQKLAEKIEKLSPAEQLIPWQELENRQKKIAEKTQEDIKGLTQTLERMKNDPLTTQRIYEEYSSLKDNLEYLHQKPMQEIFTPIKEKNLSETKNKQEEIVTNLEKMSLLNENILEYQRMYDLLTRTEELNEIGTNLTENLEKLTSLDEKTIKEFNQTLDKIGDLFNQIQQLLMKMPEELPEEFINQPAVKEINLGQTGDLLNQLKQALARGDLQQASQYAKSLAENLSKILETLQQSAQTSTYSEIDKLSEELKEHSRELDNLIEEESEEIEKTTKYEQKRLDTLFQFQGKLLEELAERQRKVIERTKKVTTSEVEKFPDFASSIQGVTGSVLPKMGKVYTEFSEKKVYDSVRLLEEIVNELKNIIFSLQVTYEIQVKEYENWQKMHTELEKKQEKPSAEFVEQGKKFEERIKNFKRITTETKWIKNEEETILDLLKKSGKPDNANFFSEKEKNELQNLSKKQDELAQRTRKLNLQLQTLGQKSALLGPELSGNLRNAQKAMQDAEEGLNRYTTDEALDKEKDALYWLSQGREGISQAMQKLAGSEKKVAQPVAGFIQYPRSGILGVKIGYVKLPGAEEYKPPKEFREEIIEALKEKYPKLYEELIKQYYKRLTE